MHRTRNDILISGFLVIVFFWFLWEARDWPLRTRFFPFAIGLPVLVLAAIQFGLSIRNACRARARGANAADRAPSAGAASVEALLAHRRTLGIAAWALAFALGLWVLGFKVGGLVLCLAFLRFQARESWGTSLTYGLVVYLFFFAGLELALAVPLPPGLLAASLGLESFDSFVVNPLLNLFSSWW